MREETPEQACNRYVKAAAAGLAKKNLYIASSNLRMAKPLATAAQKATIATMTTDLNKLGDEAIAAADKQFAEGKYAEALKEYQRLHLSLASFPGAATAKSKLDTAEKDPKCRAALQEVKAAGMFDTVELAAQRSAKAAAQPVGDSSAVADAATPAGEKDVTLADLKALPMSEQARAYQCLQTIVKQYPDTPTGQKAKALLDQLDGDATFKANLGKWQVQDAARRKFEMGENCRTSNLRNQAIACYEEVVKDYAASEYAPKAKAALAALKSN